MTVTKAASAEGALTPALTLSMAVAAGLSVANIYYNQPMLGLIARDFAGTVAGFVPAATQLGYAAGLLLLVPLGDTVDRRRLILVQDVVLVVSLVAAALAPNAGVLVAASVGIGAAATIAQQIVPLAAELAPDLARGRVVGQVMSGLLAGILLARTVSGVVGRFLGWRAMFWIGAGVAVLMAVMLELTLPRRRPTQDHGYGALLFSLVGLVRRHASLRRAVLVQGALFAAFSAFWTILALLLEGPPYHLGSDVAGYFGIVGLAGVFSAPLAGRLADKRGPAAIISLGIPIVLVGFVIFGLWSNLAGLVIGVVLLDGGIQMSMVSNQTIIFALEPSARSRINTVYMTGMFLAGALGSALATSAWKLFGWRGVTGLGTALTLVALAIHALGTFRRKSA